jgi:hypothetical protein
MIPYSSVVLNGTTGRLPAPGVHGPTRARISFEPQACEIPAASTRSPRSRHNTPGRAHYDRLALPEGERPGCYSLAAKPALVSGYDAAGRLQP